MSKKAAMMPELFQEPKEKKTVFTIGHSTLDIYQFISLLKENKIELLVDIRAYPGSRKYPQFNKEALEKSLMNNGIGYLHMLSLGGRRKKPQTAKPTGWKNESFSNYAAYMQTEEFHTAVDELEALATKKRVAFMCSEAVWWRCHRSLVSDQLKSEGWKVLHIMNGSQLREHPYTAVAEIVDGRLEYPATDSQNADKISKNI